ncbi:MAG: hypothetical protein ACMV1B_12770 [Prevotella sp.]
MTKTKIALAVLTTVALFAQPVQARFSVTRSSSVRVSSPVRASPASPKTAQAAPAQPTQQVQAAPSTPQTPATTQTAKQTPTNAERVIVRESSGNSAVANAAIGAAAGIGTVLIADALLNDNKQPAQPAVTQQLSAQQDVHPIVTPQLVQPGIEAEPESSFILIWLLISAIVGGGICKLVDTFRSRY